MTGIRGKDLLGIERLTPEEIGAVLDLADDYAVRGRAPEVLAGLTQVNLFFEPSTRTQASFEIAGRRLGADVVSMSMQTSSVAKGETLLDTAATLNAMRPDLLVVRHPQSGAVDLLAAKVDCAVLNAGDGRHEHPTQALLGRADDPSRQGSARAPHGGDLRRHRAQPRRALQHPAVRA